MLTQEQFVKATYAIVAAGILVAIALGIASELRRPAVAAIELHGTQQAAEQVDQQVRFRFTRPMDWSNKDAHFSVEPETEYTVYAAGDSAVVVFDQTLTHTTEYTIRLSDDLQDVYGKSLDDEHTYTFKTEQRALAFIVRDPDGDRIVKSNDQLQELETLYQAEAKRITRFDVSDHTLAVVAANDAGTTELVVIDRDSGQQKLLESNDRTRISSIDLSEELRQVVYTAQPVEILNGIAIAESGHEIKTYDLESGNSGLFDTGLGAQDYIDVRFTDDGVGLVVRAGDGTFYLFDYERPEINVSLGKHISVSSFSRNGDKVIFMDQPIGQTYSAFPTISIADENRDLTEIPSAGEFWIDLRFMNTTDDILYARQYKELIGSKGIFRLYRFDPETQQGELILQDERDRSLELPIPSPDDELLVVERYTEEDQLNYDNLRNIEFQTKPMDADLIIIELETGRVIDPGIRGVAAVWL